MVYEKNKLNEAGIWFIVVMGLLFGPVLYLNEPTIYGKIVGIILTSGGLFLVFYLLIYSVQKITTYDEELELSYYLRKINIPYSSIKDVQLKKQTSASEGVSRTIDVIEIILYTNKKIHLGGTFCGFFKHNTTRLYSEISKGIQKSA